MKTDRKKFGFYRIAAAVPEVSVGNPRKNLGFIAGVCDTAVSSVPDIVLFPELCISGYSCADLFYQSELLKSSEDAVKELASRSAGWRFTVIVGVPVKLDGALYNCAAVIRGGALIGIVPKTYIPNSKEFYEIRWFSSGGGMSKEAVRYAGYSVPFGTDLLFRQGELVTGIEICEDLWAPVPPSSFLALNGANLIVNPSASNELVGKSGYRSSLVRSQSAGCLCAYAYTSAGPLESTTDTVYGGHSLIAENGTVLGEGERFPREPSILIRDIDLEFIEHERINSATFGQGKRQVSAVDSKGCRVINIESETAMGFHPEETGESGSDGLYRTFFAEPFIPADTDDLAARCREIFSIQSSGLSTRLSHIGCTTAVIGLSGGLDSTLALLVTVEAFKNLKLDMKGVNCITMPGFGTTGRTLGNVEALTKRMGLPLETIDIKDICTREMKNLNHSGEPEDTAYENIQARERTMILMNRANMSGGIVIGTGDLSELALGWCTYNGDHMSMYGVNSGVPKTLVRFLIRYVADTQPDSEIQEILHDIIDTPISPELLPPDARGKIAQKTEEVIGPYILHDFFLYYGIRCGYSRKKVVFAAEKAFADRYSREEIEKWSRLFYSRFFSQQFKRSCLPDGPKVGTISLSPRGDWRMPSDADGSLWKD